MAEKVCARCGSSFAALKSNTCPHCFARLLTIDDELAEELRSARIAAEQTEDFQKAKQEDDERFREQSFSACLGVLTIAVITIAAAVVMFGIAVHRQHAKAAPAPTAVHADLSGSRGVPAAYPYGGAAVDAVFPVLAGQFSRQSADTDEVIPSSYTVIYHAVYADASGSQVDISAISAGAPTSDRNEFQLAIGLSSRLGRKNPLPTYSFYTEHWIFDAIGLAGQEKDAGDKLESALLQEYRSKQ